MLTFGRWKTGRQGRSARIATASEPCARRALAAADVEAVTAVYAKWANGDFATPEIFHDDVQVIWAEEIPGLNESRGVPALAAGARTWLEAWEHASIEAE